MTSFFLIFNVFFTYMDQYNAYGLKEDVLNFTIYMVGWAFYVNICPLMLQVMHSSF